MKFRNYCVVIMGDTKNYAFDIKKISETEPNVLDAVGIVIATFTSSLEPQEVTDWFILRNLSFLVFDLDEKNSGFNITKEIVHNKLFGFLNKPNNLDEESRKFLRAVQMTSDTKNNKIVIKEDKRKKLSKEDIKKMSQVEKEKLQDQIIDKGVENISEDDKLILGFLWKND